MTRTHIVVLPGGGYEGHADHEGRPVADWLRTLGVESSVFRYPVLARHPAPIDAVADRMSQLRADGVIRLGVLGFSAGGHLAGHAALTGLADLAILGYPVVSMVLDTHAGSRVNLLGADATDAVRESTSLENLVTAAAPPMFVWHTSDDAMVPVEHAYVLGTALNRAGVRHELHVYPSGLHGLGLAAGSGSPARWTSECAAWLAEEGWVGRGRVVSP